METLTEVLLSGRSIPTKLYSINVDVLPPKFDIADIADIDLIKQLFADKKEVELDEKLEGELGYNDLVELHSRKYRYYPTGFPEVDRYVQLPNSGLVVLSGRVNHGKTNMMINLALNLAKQTDLTVLYLSYEFPLAELNIRMIKALDGTVHTGSGWEEDLFIDQAIRDMSLPACKEYSDLLFKRKLRVVDSQTSVEQVLTVMNRLAALGKPLVVFVDYLQIIPTPTDGRARYLQLKDMVEKIRFVANKNSQLLVGGSQLTNGEIGYGDVVRESKDIDATAALHLKIWSKLKAKMKPLRFGKNGEPVFDTSYDTVNGDYVLIVEKARQSSANGRMFGFNSTNGCDLKPASLIIELQTNTQEF